MMVVVMKFIKIMVRLQFQQEVMVIMVKILKNILRKNVVHLLVLLKKKNLHCEEKS